MYLPLWALDRPIINSFDIDGVIYMGEGKTGVFPGPGDIIITGRSYEERTKTLKMLSERGIENAVFFNPLKEVDKTRLSSGRWKASTLRHFLESGVRIGIHFEDDPIQVEVIKSLVYEIKVVHLVHDITEK